MTDYSEYRQYVELLHREVPAGSIQDAEVLYYYASKSSGLIVEIGSLKGGSTRCLLEGSKNKNIVVSIDWHKGDDTGGGSGGTLVNLKNNTSEYSNIEFIIDDFYNFDETWLRNRKIGLFCYDADHTTKATIDAYNIFMPYFNYDCVALIHDQHDKKVREALEFLKKEYCLIEEIYGYTSILKHPLRQ